MSAPAPDKEAYERLVRAAFDKHVPPHGPNEHYTLDVLPPMECRLTYKRDGLPTARVVKANIDRHLVMLSRNPGHHVDRVVKEMFECLAEMPEGMVFCLLGPP